MFGWAFVIEHATDFAWGDGPGDYALIQTNGAVCGGLAEVGEPHETGWISYARTEDIDRTLKNIERQGGSILRAPFNVEGVGKNAVALSPGGAHFGLSTPSYEPPEQNSIFVADMILAREPSGSDAFFRSIGLAGRNSGIRSIDSPAGWKKDDVMFPLIGVTDCRKAITRSQQSGARLLRASEQPVDCHILLDPAGTVFGVARPQVRPVEDR